jgi:hypothetical protein
VPAMQRARIQHATGKRNSMKLDTMKNGQQVTIDVHRPIRGKTACGRKKWKIDPDRNVGIGLAIMRNTTVIYEGGIPVGFKWPEKPENPTDEEWRRETGMQPGDIATFQEMADRCGVSRQNMSLIFERTMRKIRIKLYQDKTIEKELKEYLEKNSHLKV